MIATLDPDRWFNLQAWTLQQPYASGIALGADPARLADGRWKDVENRGQRRHLPPEGRWYGLHAGKVVVPGIAAPAPWVSALPQAWGELPRGVMLGAFHVARCVRYPGRAAGPALLEETDPYNIHGNPSAFGPWCYLVDRVALLPEPMPCRGMNGSWPIAVVAGPEVAKAVELAVAEWHP